MFELGQRAGVDILPRHFYSAIPHVAELRRGRDWRRPRTMAGVRGTDLDEQIAFARSCCTPDLVQQIRSSATLYADACARNGAVGYGPIESELLYCFIASRRPRRVVQVGCGVSTAVMLRAAREHDVALEIVCVDPYPTAFLVEAAQRGEIVLLAEPAQEVSLDALTALSSGDLLFVDSTHTVKPGSEVNRLILEVLPRLAQGVYVHFHDIWFPYDHGWTILQEDLFFWNESVLLHAFLAHNDRYTLRLAMSMLHDADPGSLQELLPSYRPARCQDGLRLAADDRGHLPAAAYLEVVGR